METGYVHVGMDKWLANDRRKGMGWEGERFTICVGVVTEEEEEVIERKRHEPIQVPGE